MGMRFSKLINVFILVAASTTGFSLSAIAQTESSDFTHTVPDGAARVIERALFHESRDYFENRSIERQAQLIFGPPVSRNKFIATYPDLEFERDSALNSVLYRDILAQQTLSDPFLRTPDLPSPFETSVLQRRYNPQSRLGGSELVFERVPLR